MYWIIKTKRLTKNISTALTERYTTPINSELLAKMIESYVYLDSVEFDVF